MRVRMLVAMAGPRMSRPVGAEVDLPGDEARRLVEAGFADLVRAEAVETATVRPAEKAVRR